MVQMHLMILMKWTLLYYSSEICHNKGDQYMDKAIMRNNIYVLKVTGFENIGGATITIDPSGGEE